MAPRTNLDMNVLRTFVTGFRLGSFGLAAGRLGRSQSAVSTQLRKLEDQLGLALVRRSGRGLALTAAGENLMSYAQRILDLNDEAVEAVRGAEVAGWARLGLPQDFAESWLPAVLRSFARSHPGVRVEVQVDRSVPLVEKVGKGELDIALVWGDAGGGTRAEKIADLPVRWIGPRGWPGVGSLGGDPLPFAAFAPPCSFRSAAIAALDAAGQAWRLVFTSPSLSGLWAAAEGGLGITARTAVDMPANLAVLDPKGTGLPPLPSVPLTLHRAEADPATAVVHLTEILIDTVRDRIGSYAVRD